MRYFIVHYSRSMYERMQRMVNAIVDEDSHVCYYEYTSNEPHEVLINMVSEDEFLKHYQ